MSFLVGGLLGGDSTNINHIKDTTNSTKEQKQKKAQEALKQWWDGLSTEVKDQIKKTDGKGDDGKGKPFLERATNSLQPIIDIAFYRYWDLDQARETEGDSKGERYISGEQTYRFLDDLVRDNEDAAVGALKEYLKFKLLGVEGGESVKTKSTELTEEAKKEALAKYDLETANQLADKDAVEDFEKAIAAAKEAGLEVKKEEEALEKLKKEAEAKKEAEEKLKTALEEATAESYDKPNYVPLQQAINKAASVGADVGEAKEKLSDLQAAKKLKGAAEDDKAKAVRLAIVHKEQKVFDDAKKKKDDDLAKIKTTREEGREKEEKAAEEKCDKEFSSKYKEAVDAVVSKLGDEYKKNRYSRRQAAYASFRGALASQDKITQNELNKIFNLHEAETFNSICTELGFNPDSVDAVMEKLSEKPPPPEEEKKEEEKKDEEKKEEEGEKKEEEAKKD
jgi:hypothetical protein